MSALSILAYERLATSGNGFELQSTEAFVGLLGHGQIAPCRMAGLLLAWCVRLLPYILLAWGLRRTGLARLAGIRNRSIVLVLAAAFAVADLWTGMFPALRELSLAFCLFGLGVALSAWLKPQAWTAAAGRWAFGIYLSHFVFVQGLQQVCMKTGLLTSKNMSLFTLIGLSLAAYSASVVFCLLVERKGGSRLGQLCGLAGR
jgi:peptidoglycan/LPS O-acetylase OafA/YrhL